MMSRRIVSQSSYFVSRAFLSSSSEAAQARARQIANQYKEEIKSGVLGTELPPHMRAPQSFDERQHLDEVDIKPEATMEKVVGKMVDAKENVKAKVVDAKENMKTKVADAKENVKAGTKEAVDRAKKAVNSDS